MSLLDLACVPHSSPPNHMESRNYHAT